MPYAAPGRGAVTSRCATRRPLVPARPVTTTGGAGREPVGAGDPAISHATDPAAAERIDTDFQQERAEETEGDSYSRPRRERRGCRGHWAVAQRRRGRHATQCCVRELHWC